MLTAAAVCPHPPLLVPAATGAIPGPADTELQQLRAACRQAVAALLAGRPDLIAVVGCDPRAGHTTEYPPGAPGHLHELGVPFTTGPAQPGTPSLPLSLTVGKWLLSGAIPDRAAPPAAWWGFELMLREGAHLVGVGFALAAPAGASVFLVDVAMGLVNRVAPQIQVHFLAMSIKPLVVVFVMLTALSFFSDELVHQFAHSLHAMRQVVEVLR